MLALLLLLLAVVAQGPLRCAAGGACEANEDASLLQVQPVRHAAEAGRLVRGGVAEVWLTSVDSNAKATGLLVKGDDVHIQSASGASIGRSSAARDVQKPHREVHRDPPTMTCAFLDGSASRACSIIPPRSNTSLVEQASRRGMCCSWNGETCPPASNRCDADKAECEGNSCRGQWLSLSAAQVSASRGSRTWADMNGGTNQTCRGDSSSDNSDSYFHLVSANSLNDCRQMCEAANCCTGMEYNPASGRCELWTKKIQASSTVTGYTCQVWNPQPQCEPWDGVTRIDVDATKEFQTMQGFGAAMTQSSAHVLKKLKDKDSTLYNKVMNRLFGVGGKAAGISMVRFPIGSCDYSRTEQTYDDVPQPPCASHKGECHPSCSKPNRACDPILAGDPYFGMAGNCLGACGTIDCSGCTHCQECCCVASDYGLSSFGLDYETQDIVEVLQDAKAKNPNLVIMGSPWTPPRWLKWGGTLGGNSNQNTLMGGSAVLNAYAEYFLKVKQTFAGLGLPLDYLTLQNEPLYAPHYPGMYLSAEDYAILGQKVREKLGSTPKLLAYDHNWDHPEYATEVFQKAPGVFNGTAFHCYAGQMSAAHKAVQTAYPDMEILMSECTGSYPNSQCDISKGMDGFGWNHEWDMSNLLVNNVVNGGSGSTKWVMVLDQNCGPYLPSMSFHWGRPLVSIPDWAISLGDIKFNQDFWSIAHLGRFVRPGAVMIERKINEGGSTSQTVAFKDADAGTVTFIVVNTDHANPLDLEITYLGSVIQYVVPAWGTAVLRWPLSS